jgi:hypothetical protein
VIDPDTMPSAVTQGEPAGLRSGHHT